MFKSYKYMFKFFGPYKNKALKLFIIILLGAGFEACGLGFIVPVLESALGQNNESSIFKTISDFLFTEDNKLLGWAILSIFAFFLKFIFSLIKSYSSAYFVNEIRMYWTHTIFKKHLYADFKEIQKYDKGKFVNNMVNEPFYSSKGLKAFIELNANLLIIFCILSVLLVINLKVTLFVIAATLILALIIWKISSSFSKNVGKLKINLNQKINSIAIESVSGIKQLKVFNIEDRALVELWNILSKLKDITSKFVVAKDAPKPFGELFIVSIMMFFLVYTRYYLNLDLNEILPSLGVFTLGFLRLFSLTSSVLSMRMQVLNYLPSLELIQKLQEVTPSEQKEDVSNLPDNFKAKEITLKDVSFEYIKGEPVLKSINLTFKAGNFIGLIGKSGSGKTTVCDLIMKLYKAQSQGQILVNNFPLRDIAQDEWRNHIGYVSQDPFLFNSSIKENIILNNEYNKERFIEAIKISNSAEFINDLTDKEDTILGAEGINISGGQKQRLTIARALYKSPDIIIFDEATSSLDPISEKIILKSLKEVSSQKIVIMITHKESTLSYTDHIYLMAKGKIIEEGTYRDLMSKDDSLLNNLMNQENV